MIKFKSMILTFLDVWNTIYYILDLIVWPCPKYKTVPFKNF